MTTSVSWMRLVLGLQFLLTVPTVVINIFVCIAFKRHRSLWTFSNFFLLSLSIADLVSALFRTLLHLLAELMLDTDEEIITDFKEFVCYFYFCSETVSCVNIACLSVERWIYIAKPYLYARVFTKRSIFICFSLVWGTYFVLLVVSTVCSFLYTHYEGYVVATDALNVISVAISIVLILIQSHIVYIIKKQIRAILRICPSTIRSNKKGAGSPQNLSQNSRGLRMLIEVWGTFFILSTIPGIFSSFQIHVGPETDEYDMFCYAFIVTSRSLYHLINFFIHSARNRELRRGVISEMQRALCMGESRRRTISSTDSQTGKESRPL